MQALKAELLRGCWYIAAPSAEVKRGKSLAKTLLGETVLLVRGQNDGKVFAIRDICPHRGIPLRYGKVMGDTVQCCYHGWRFGSDGACVEIPSLREGQQVDLQKIRCGSYTVMEKFGLIWIYFPVKDEAPSEGPMPDVDFLPGIRPEMAPTASIMLPFDCSIDHAAFGLMDPTHAAYVHTSWWFKRDATKLRPKEKSFEPAPFGWRMVRHKLPPQNLVYKLLGKDVTTEIAYRLPGYRIESVEGSRHTAIGLTAMTPVTEEKTEVYQIFYATMGWMKPAGPLVRHLMRVFLDQDRDVVVKQREGLMHNPKLMMVNDSDTQARWWARIKAEWIEAEAEKRPFANPLKAQVLRWKS